MEIYLAGGECPNHLSVSLEGTRIKKTAGVGPKTRSDSADPSGASVYGSSVTAQHTSLLWERAPPDLVSGQGRQCLKQQLPRAPPYPRCC